MFRGISAALARPGISGAHLLLICLVAAVTPSCKKKGQEAGNERETADSTTALMGRASAPSFPAEKIAELERQCTTLEAELSPSGASADWRRSNNLGQAAVLRLVPLKRVLDDTDGAWQSVGKFVGVVQNWGDADDGEFIVDRRSGNRPGKTCVWFGFEPNTTKLAMILVRPDGNTKPYYATRVDHSSHPHKYPLASWHPKTQALVDFLEKRITDAAPHAPAPLAPFTVPTDSMTILETAAWFTCDQGGCCKRN